MFTALVIERADHFSFELHCELLNQVIDGLRSGRHLNFAVIFTGSQFACTNTSEPFRSRTAICAKLCPKAITLCHCVLLFQSRLSFFQDLVVATENFVIMAPFGTCLVSAFLPIKPIIMS